ncbi:MAG: hypothetical protein Q9222_007148, partial [Ikaeria aurantiellina]
MAPITTICEEEELPIALMPTLPRLKFHEAPFYFMSEPGMTQQEYQKKVLRRGYNPNADDTITIKCPDREDGAGRIFRCSCSTLRRSPTFAKFFDSPYYLHGCNMNLTFVVDPAVCIDITYRYLEEGPDVFQQTVLRVQLTMRYKLVDRSIILVRLYALAQKLALPGLMDMAFGVLREGEQQLQASDIISLASLVFARTMSFDVKLREWCLTHVQKCLPELKESLTWREVLYKADSELPQRWSMFLEEEIARLRAVNGGVGDGEMHRLIDRMTSGTVKNDSSSTTANKEQAFQHVLDEFAHQSEETDDEWDASEDLLASSENHGTSSKILRLLGPLGPSPPNKLRKEMSVSHSLSSGPGSPFSPGIDKARFVMGYSGTPSAEEKLESCMRTSMSNPNPLPTPTKSARKLKLWP